MHLKWSHARSKEVQNKGKIKINQELSVMNNRHIVTKVAMVEVINYCIWKRYYEEWRFYLQYGKKKNTWKNYCIV